MAALLHLVRLILGWEILLNRVTNPLWGSVGSGVELEYIDARGGVSSFHISTFCPARIKGMSVLNAGRQWHGESKD